MAALPQIYTLDEFVQHLHYLPQSQEKGLPKLLLNRIIQQNTKQTMANFPSLLNSLFSFLQQYPYYCAPSSHCEYNEAIPNLQKIITEYTAAKKSHNLFQTSDYYLAECAQNFQQIQLIVSKKQVFFLGFFEDVPLKNTILKAIIQNSVASYLLLQYDRSKLQLDACSGFYFWLKQQVPDLTEITSAHDISKPLAAVSVFKLKSIEEEIVFIFKKIKTLLQQQTNAASDFAIVCPNLDYYSTFFTSLAQKYQLPLDFNYAKPLSSTPIGSLVLNLFQVLLTNGQRASVINLLKSPFAQELNGQAIHADFIQLTAQKIHITEDLSQWQAGWQKHLKEIQQLMDYLKNAGAENIDKYDKNLQMLISQGQVLTELFQQIQQINQSLNIQDFIVNIKKIFDMLNLQTKFTAFNTADAKKDYAYQALLAYQKMLNILDYFGQNHDILQQHKKFSVSAAIASLQMLLTETSLQQGATKNGGIAILEKTEALGIEKKYLFVCGLVEDFWPKKEHNDLLFSNELRQKMGLPTHRTMVLEDYFILSSLLTQSTENVFLTFPEKKDGQLCLSSHFFNRLSQEQALNLTPVEPDANTAILSLEEQQILQGETHKTPLCSQEYGQFQIPWFQDLIYQAFASQVFSATQLEEFQKCPYSFFFRYVLKEKGLPEYTEDIANYLWGTIIHKLFYRFYKENQLPLNWASQPETQNQARQFLTQLANQILKEFALDNLFWEVKRSQLIDRPDSIINLFIRQEEQQSLELTPNPDFLEKEFHHTLTQDTQSISLTGKIDAVLTSGVSSFFAVLDYKTGSNLPSAKDLELFRSLQLPIYMLIGQEMLAEKTVAAGIIYQMKDHNNFQKKWICISEAAKAAKLFDLGRTRPYQLPDNYFAQLTEHLIYLKSLIQAGNFNFNKPDYLAKLIPAPCEHCNYKYFCR